MLVTQNAAKLMLTTNKSLVLVDLSAVNPFKGLGQHLKPTKLIKLLNLSGWSIKAKDLRSLKHLRLETLNLSGTNINDECVEVISQFTTLRTLNVSNCGQVKDGWKHIASMMIRFHFYLIMLQILVG
jgi:hypothetical protein